MDTIKRICIVENPTITHAKKDKPPPKKRAITTTKKWDFSISTLTLEYQLSLLDKCFSTDYASSPPTDYASSPPSTDYASSPPSTDYASSPPTDSSSPTISDTNNASTDVDETISRVRVLEQLIHSKWYGYRSQDIEKQILHPDKFISERDIAQTLVDSRLSCFYCRKPVQLFYEFVRESNQWTLDRIDNTYGHNHDNVVIACLGCNLRRKTMYYERFVMTKQMTITKTGKT
jgi:hypothetical protein